MIVDLTIEEVRLILNDTFRISGVKSVFGWTSPVYRITFGDNLFNLTVTPDEVQLVEGDTMRFMSENVSGGKTK
jgi:hypothetical protein